MSLRWSVVALACLVGHIAVVAAKDWWQTALVYQIYPRSYKDSNGDGIGDLNGITEKLDYIQELGMEAIWLSPIFLSPMYDFGYDISDYRQIAPEYGTMQDFERLLAEAKRRNMKIVLDFVPNHTSNESDWFVRSARRERGYEDYYVWADGRNNNSLPPNNWVSVFRKSAWEWNDVRKQYYLHQFAIGQPDLNYRSPKVVEEMQNVLRFWLDKGVSGFRVDAINFLYEVDPKDFGGVFPDEPLSGAKNLGPDDYDYLDHIYTKNLPPTYDIVYGWRDVLNEYTKTEPKLMLLEAYADIHDVMRYYGRGSREGGIPFNFEFLSDINNGSNARDIKYVIDKWMTYMPDGKTANWVNGNHDNSRLATRDGVDRVDMMNMLALLLPDITITYQGEEIAMTDGYISWQDTVDPQACNTDDPINYYKYSRDPTRTPFHWDASRNAGFSNTTGKTWLPLADNYQTVNVAVEKAATKSHYKFYKDVASIRRSAPVRMGDIEVKALSDDIIVVCRLLPGDKAVVGVANISPAAQTADLSAFRTLPKLLTVVASGVDSDLQKGAEVNKDTIRLSPHSAVVLQSVKNVPDFENYLDVIKI